MLRRGRKERAKTRRHRSPDGGHDVPVVHGRRERRAHEGRRLVDVGWENGRGGERPGERFLTFNLSSRPASSRSKRETSQPRRLPPRHTPSLLVLGPAPNIWARMGEKGRSLRRLSIAESRADGKCPEIFSALFGVSAFFPRVEQEELRWREAGSWIHPCQLASRSRSRPGCWLALVNHSIPACSMPVQEAKQTSRTKSRGAYRHTRCDEL
jgi:hypothetical protein